MIIIKNIEHLNDIIRFHKHENKKIGKLDANYNKFLSEEFYLHSGHVECIKTLKDNGCDIIIIECINTVKAYNSTGSKQDVHNSRGYLHYKEKVINDDKLVEYCNKIGIDYLIYNSNDYKPQINKELIKLVDRRIRKEQYKDLLKLDEEKLSILRVNLIVRTFRGQNSDTTGITYVRCYKDGPVVFGIKHYVEKYLSQKLILIPPKTDLEYFPLSSTNKPELNNNIILFLNYFQNKTDFNTDNKILLEQIKNTANNLSINIDIDILNNKLINGTFINIKVTTKDIIFYLNKLI